MSRFNFLLGIVALTSVHVSMSLQIAASPVLYAISFGFEPLEPPARLFTVDIEAGHASLVGPTGFDRVIGLTADAENELIGLSGQEFVRFDLTTGQATPFGETDLDIGEGGISWNPQTGQYLLLDSTEGDLYRFDPLTGESSFVGALGVRRRDLSALGYGPDGLLYTVHTRSFAPVNDYFIAQVSPATGVLINRLSLGDISPFPGDAGVGGMAFHPDTGIGYFSNGYDLFSYDPLANSVEFVGSTGEARLSGLAFVVPEPTSWVLWIGLLGSTRRF